MKLRIVGSLLVTAEVVFLIAVPKRYTTSDLAMHTSIAKPKLKEGNLCSPRTVCTSTQCNLDKRRLELEKARQIGAKSRQAICAASIERIKNGHTFSIYLKHQTTRLQMQTKL